MFDTVLVANRGEIAVRVCSTLRRMGIRSVAIFSDEDVDARHVREADLALHVGPANARESYLNIERVIDAALRARAQAIHPGYGFLSENASFVRACEQAGLTFIGPSVEAVEVMGDKIRARAAAVAAGVLVVPGRARPAMSDEDLVEAAREVGYPVLVKPSAGGGGKGMHVVTSPEELRGALVSARREALAGFGDDALFVERYLERPRHLEVQILFDHYGNAVHLGERECSLQRRHQKVIEEAPSPLLDERSREDLCAAALRVGQGVHYRGVGTVEFITSGENPGEFYFMEMNTRLQVEHPVTEMVTGIDLVEQQLRVAALEPLNLSQGEVHLRGHAVEARVYAEDPARGFLPSGGDLLYVEEPRGEGVRVDSSWMSGVRVGTTYDPLLAKVIAHGSDRAEALARLDRALAESITLGVVTNTSFLRTLLARGEVRDGDLDTDLVARVLGASTSSPSLENGALIDAVAGLAVARLFDLERRSRGHSRFDVPDGWRLGEHAATKWSLLGERDERVEVSVTGNWRDARVNVAGALATSATSRCFQCALVGERAYELLLSVEGRTSRFLVALEGRRTWVWVNGVTTLLRPAPRTRTRDEGDERDGEVRSPMPGIVIEVRAKPGDEVAKGDALVVVEAMKMEHALATPLAGFVTGVSVNVGDQVVVDQVVANVSATLESHSP
ncbi:MAG TPA: biotin carboxylase N-terminal domain-containing protein [Acidimicrobiales bacterium]|nr:biotin carboxylase N-terminal domain-containing protein [Acidimicrobiales bacterium]